MTPILLGVLLKPWQLQWAEHIASLHLLPKILRDNVGMLGCRFHVPPWWLYLALSIVADSEPERYSADQVVHEVLVRVIPEKRGPLVCFEHGIPCFQLHQVSGVAIACIRI